MKVTELFEESSEDFLTEYKKYRTEDDRKYHQDLTQQFKTIVKNVYEMYDRRYTVRGFLSNKPSETEIEIIAEKPQQSAKDINPRLFQIAVRKVLTDSGMEIDVGNLHVESTEDDDIVKVEIIPRGELSTRLQTLPTTIAAYMRRNYR